MISEGETKVVGYHENLAREGGVFESLVNRASFVDRIVMSVWGIRRCRPLGGICTGPSRAIGGEKRLYARSIPIALPVVGNHGELRYGRLRPWKPIPQFRLVMHSVDSPLDQIQVDGVLSNLMRCRYRCAVSLIEMAFDTRGIPIQFFGQHLFTNARKLSLWSDLFGRQTLYIGAPRAAWQLRIYQKTDDIVRLEYVLRRPFLSHLSVHLLEDVLLLKHVDLSHLASFKEFSQHSLNLALTPLRNDWRKRLLLEWPQHRPLQLLAQALWSGHRIHPAPLLHSSGAEQLLRQMQDQFIW